MLVPPTAVDAHPLGCHRPRVAGRVCFEGISIRLVTGCAWVDAEALLGGQVSDTKLRARRDEWIAAGVFDALADEAIAAFDRIVGLAFSECAVDGSQHKAPAGGEGTGPNPVDRGRSGWKWSLFADRHGIPIGWTAAGANRNDCIVLAPTLESVMGRGLLAETETLHLDRGYDNRNVRHLVASVGISDLVCARLRPRGTATTTKLVPLGPRWPIERTNSRLSKLRATPPQHRPAQHSPAWSTLPRDRAATHREAH
jgi:hypothetical protein